MAKRKNTEVVVRKDTQVASTDDFNQQKELAKEMMRRQARVYGPSCISDPEAYIAKFEIVKRADGTIVSYPREKPFKNDPERPGMSLMVRSPFSDMMGLDGPRRGKYNDVDRLFFNEYGSVEVGEVAAVGSVG